MENLNYTNLDPVNSFKDELNKNINKRVKYEHWDFILAHSFIWLSIIASFTSSIMIAAGVESINKIWVAIIAGIPGLVVVVEKSFDFARRTAWDTMYKIDMQELKDDIEFQKIDAYTASKRFREIARKHETSFLTIGFFSQNDRDNNPPDAQSDSTITETQTANGEEKSE
jgi:hypothetical protein